jgi:hypothetical protein
MIDAGDRGRLEPVRWAEGPPLPRPRGPLTESLLTALVGPADGVVTPPPDVADPLGDDDLQLFLYVCYELHYRSFAGVDARWEWEPSLLRARARAEAVFEEALRDAVVDDDPHPHQVEPVLRQIIDEDGPGPLARFLEREASLRQFQEFMVHRSGYQLKEADPHSWAIPRLAGPAKAALVEVQADEYGGGRPGRMHATLFARAMRAVNLDDRYGAYLDHIPGTTLATVNAMSLFGLHRRLVGAIAGHLAAFEATSAEPNGRYARGLRRLGLGDDATEFFDEHVEADALHEAVAVHDVAGALAHSQPELAADIVFGARALLMLEATFALSLIEAWEAGRSSLRLPLDVG